MSEGFLFKVGDQQSIHSVKKAKTTIRRCYGNLLLNFQRFLCSFVITSSTEVSLTHFGRKSDTGNPYLIQNTYGWLFIAFTLFISSLSFMLFIMLLNNLPVSLDAPLNYICTQVNIIVETYILLNPKPKVKFYTRQNPKWFEKYIPNCILSFFYVP